MANRNRGWSKLNKLHQREINKSRGKIEKVVDIDGNFIKFQPDCSKRKQMNAGWNWRNKHKTERKQVEAQLKKEHWSRKQKRAVREQYGRGKRRINLRRPREAKVNEG